jgi:hypothetical protein
MHHQKNYRFALKHPKRSFFKFVASSCDSKAQDSKNEQRDLLFKLLCTIFVFFYFVFADYNQTTRKTVLHNASTPKTFFVEFVASAFDSKSQDSKNEVLSTTFCLFYCVFTD